MEDQIDKLTEELRKLQEISELEKETNAQLEIQVNELKDKLNNKKVQQQLEESVEIAELNRKIKELQKQLDEVEKNYQSKLDDCKREQKGLNDLLEKERQKIKKWESQEHETESSQQMIDKLMERVALVEKEKAELNSRYAKYATVNEEVESHKKRMSDINKLLESTEKALDKEKSDKASIQHSHEELLHKMKELQNENDRLVVKLEGLKTENEGLITKNKKLEDRIKNLDVQNKQQLQQINETLKMPAPLTLDRDVVATKTAKDLKKVEEIRVKKIEETRVKKFAADDLAVQSAKEAPFDSLRRLSSPPTSLMIPAINASDEKRPATPTKSLKVVPVIIEPTFTPTPSVGSNVSALPKEQGNTSTINSQVAPTIPNDSPIQGSSKAFAEAFSRSCKSLAIIHFHFH